MPENTNPIDLLSFTKIMDAFISGLLANPLPYYQFLLQGINEKTAAKMTGYSTRTLQGFRLNGGGPAFSRPTKNSVRYRRIDCLLWLENAMHTNTSQYASISDTLLGFCKSINKIADNDNSEKP